MGLLAEQFNLEAFDIKGAIQEILARDVVVFGDVQQPDFGIRENALQTGGNLAASLTIGGLALEIMEEFNSELDYPFSQDELIQGAIERADALRDKYGVEALQQMKDNRFVSADTFKTSQDNLRVDLDDHISRRQPQPFDDYSEPTLHLDYSHS